MPCCIEYALNMYGEPFAQCFNHYVDACAGNSGASMSCGGGSKKHLEGCFKASHCLTRPTSDRVDCHLEGSELGSMYGRSRCSKW